MATKEKDWRRQRTQKPITMSKTKLMYTSPGSLCMRADCCEYCYGASSESVQNITCLARLHGIIACPDHVAAAKRDNNAFLHEHHMVDICDFLKRFPELSDRKDIKIPRSDGSVTEGGYIATKTFDDEPFLRFTESWHIRVRWVEPDEPKMKDIKVEDLALSGIDTAPILKALSDGFYSADVDARNAVIESCSSEERRKAEDAIEPVGAFRVIIPGEGIRYASVI